MSKQERKVYKGKKNDKERTMGKLLASVGKVFKYLNRCSIVLKGNVLLLNINQWVR